MFFDDIDDFDEIDDLENIVVEDDTENNETSFPTPYLDQYTTNLSIKAQSRPDDYEVYGREKEIEDIIISLMRKTKNSPLLIGEAGVGKTAIVEGVALRIIRNQVPESLQDLTVRSLELSSLMSDTVEGSFLTKFKAIIEELVATKGENLLFIDEIHT
ncbi:ATP-dependent Clp protease ATP-binding subunit, partial [Lactobacillus salivarius]|nr:ATP-dependent Clp protease ATP-binding subunit [Ligilactobacillus salivarius]